MENTFNALHNVAVKTKELALALEELEQAAENLKSCSIIDRMARELQFLMNAPNENQRKD